jgi:hypothetical protein
MSVILDLKVSCANMAEVIYEKAQLPPIWGIGHYPIFNYYSLHDNFRNFFKRKQITIFLHFKK